MIGKKMNVTEIAEEYLSRFRGRRAVLLSYEAFDQILRVSIADMEDEDWIVSFAGCSQIQSKSNWEISGFKVRTLLTDPARIVEDSVGGFRVQCRNVYVINADEYHGGQ